MLAKQPGSITETMALRMSRLIVVLVLAIIPWLSGCDGSEVNVTTQRYDNARTGQNLAETLLKTSNVNAAQFGKVFELPVDDEVYAQPLYVSDIGIPGIGRRNVLYVATVNNSVFAFDADNADDSAPLWRVKLTPNMGNARPVRAREVGQRCHEWGGYKDFSKNIGIVGTPVIHLDRRTIYLVARTKEKGRFVQRLHSLDIATGAPRPNSPVVIKASTTGTGVGSVNGVIEFDPEIHNQRAALLLANGRVYIAWASHCDTGPYHGWIMAYDAESLDQVAATVVTPEGEFGGIWQSNSGPSADSQGNIYLTTGNGSFAAPKGGRDFGNAFLKLSSSLEVLDWFVPFNFEAFNVADHDLGSSGVLLVPGTELLASGGKGGGQLYLLDRRSLGRFKPDSNDQIIQSLTIGGGGLYGTATYWDGPDGPHIYVWPRNEVGKMFKLHKRHIEQVPVSTTIESTDRPGGILAVSANGKTAGTGILWAVTGEGNANVKRVWGALRAFDATDLSAELWNSKQNSARDKLGRMAKFNTPVIANGKVYVATFSKKIVVYGLLPML